jgi:CHAT domain-containing protein/Tfp pilus assembly protein PilF
MHGGLCLAAFLSLSVSLPAQSPPATEATLLKLHKPIERQMRGVEKHSYKIRARRGQFVHVVVLQEGIDVVVSLRDPSGKQIVNVDSMNGAYGPEPVSTIVEDAGDLQLEVSSTDPDAPPGRYQVQLTDVRLPAEADRIRILAERTYLDGYQISSSDKAAAVAKWQESFARWHSLDDKYGQALSLDGVAQLYAVQGQNQKALDYFNQAVPLEHAAGDRALEAATLNSAGLLYDGMGEKQKALDDYNRALPLRRAAKDTTGEVITLNGIASVYSDLGEKQKALDDYNQALPLERITGDRRHEAFTLGNMAVVYNGLGQKQKALDYYNQALPLHHALGDRAREALTLRTIAEIASNLGEKQKALDNYNQALPIIRALGYQAAEAAMLSDMASIYSGLEEKQKALDDYNQALLLQRAVGDHQGELVSLHEAATDYSDLGEKQKALDYYHQALQLERAAGDTRDEAATLNSLGVVYSDLGDMVKAAEYFSQALPLRRVVKDRDGEAATLLGIGGIYSTLLEKQKALGFFLQALTLLQAVGDRRGEAYALNNIGVIQSDLGEKQKALDDFNQALPLDRVLGNHAAEATTLYNIGRTYAELGENQKALHFYSQSIPLYRVVQDPLGEGSVLSALMEYWQGLQRPGLAVLFGKEAIDRFQHVRRDIGGLDKDTQRSFLRSKKSYYRELAELLISDGRLPEAQQVMDMLKAEEYSEFTQRRGDAGSATSAVTRTPMEQTADKQYGQITAGITAIGEQWTQLNNRSSRSAEEEKRYAELSDQLTAANQQLQAYLNTLYQTFGKGDQANARVETIDDQTGSLETLVGELGNATVAVYTIVLDQKCVLMVITPATRVAREVPIGKTALRDKVFAFISALQSNAADKDIQAQGQELYDILIAPIAQDLQAAHPATLVWSLDDVLRYVPLAALYDGKQYLVERYRNVMITTASAGNLKDQPQITNWRGVAMGVSKDYDGLGRLKAVPGELASVIHSDGTSGSLGAVPGTILLDDSFTERNMETALAAHPALVHIASHYVFQGGDDKSSYLLLGGKDLGGQGFHLTLADLRDDQRMDFKGIELLTLSGCQTAVGAKDADGREIDGLGITAQRKGAKAVVATLWPVDDSSVGLLMATFYKLWISTPGMTKSEALQQAQLTLLHGTTAGPAGATRGASLLRPASAAGQGATPMYANPYYWAPFVLIGNWK